MRVLSYASLPGILGTIALVPVTPAKHASKYASKQKHLSRMGEVSSCNHRLTGGLEEKMAIEENAFLFKRNSIIYRLIDCTWDGVKLVAA